MTEHICPLCGRECECDMQGDPDLCAHDCEAERELGFFDYYDDVPSSYHEFGDSECRQGE